MKKINPHNVSDRLYPLHRAVSLDTKSIISIFEHYRNVCVWERECGDVFVSTRWNRLLAPSPRKICKITIPVSFLLVTEKSCRTIRLSFNFQLQLSSFAFWGLSFLFCIVPSFLLRKKSQTNSHAHKTLYI